MRNITREDIEGRENNQPVYEIYQTVCKFCPRISDNDPAELMRKSFNEEGSIIPFAQNNKDRYEILRSSQILNDFLEQCSNSKVSIIYQDIIIQYENGFTVAVYQNVVHVFWKDRHEYYISNGEDFEVLN
jgi:hypothetical protein